MASSGAISVSLRETSTWPLDPCQHSLRTRFSVSATVESSPSAIFMLHFFTSTVSEGLVTWAVHPESIIIQPGFG